MWDDSIINKTLFFAINAHGNQKMKYPENMPYCDHLFGVLLTAINHVDDKNLNWTLLAQTALLHDTLEDTKVKYNDLKEEFGEDVASGVLALTKDKSLPKESQIPDCIYRIKLQPKEIAIVKLADRCFNIRGKVPVWTKEKQLKYIIEAQLICDSLGYSSSKLRNKLQSNINNLKKLRT